MEIEVCVEKTLVRDMIYTKTKEKRKKYTHFCGFFAGRSTGSDESSSESSDESSDESSEL